MATAIGSVREPRFLYLWGVIPACLLCKAYSDPTLASHLVPLHNDDMIVNHRKKSEKALAITRYDPQVMTLFLIMSTNSTGFLLSTTR